MAKAEAARRRAEEPWAEHADSREVRPVGVPVVVLGHKWDEFEANHGEPEKRKVLTRCLRYFCHVHGASLVCTKHKDSASKYLLRNLLSHLVFGNVPIDTDHMQLSHLKPLFVPVCADSFKGIGNAPTVPG